LEQLIEQSSDPDLRWYLKRYKAGDCDSYDMELAKSFISGTALVELIALINQVGINYWHIAWRDSAYNKDVYIRFHI
jgi:hypothetical protein